MLRRGLNISSQRQRWSRKFGAPSFALRACLLLVCASAMGAEDSQRIESNRIQFNRDVRPILANNCYACHGPDGNHREAELRLDDRDSALADRGTEHAAIVPGSPGKSGLILRIENPDEQQRMPPPDSGKQLTLEQIEILRQWISEGAEYQPHWAYVSPRHWSAPSVEQTQWPRSELDVFLLARMERSGLPPAPEADRVTLARRLYFDLWGLPPTAEEVAAFVGDARPDAYEQLVDRLLAAPHFGERMAMYWLDLIRYADTVGYHGDQEHNISPFRDYVIQAFNDNMPFDQFTREQLAGDLLPDRKEEQWIGSGYNRILQTSHEGGVQVQEYLTKYSTDRVRNFGQVWLGSTLGCAQCHDHKFDPFSQRDFYSIAAFFADVDDLQTFKGGDTNPTKREPEIAVLSRADQRLRRALEAELESVTAQLATLASQEMMTGLDEQQREDRTALEARRQDVIAKVEAMKAHERRTMVTVAIDPRPIRVLSRGDWMDESGEIVSPAVPAFLPQLATSDGRLTRLDLANWLTSRQHPLTSRVFVNRMWALYFGNGLCLTLEDLGTQGQPPTHPELLDELAMDFVESGWDVKQLVRRIVTTSAYRQSSQTNDQYENIDPKNTLFTRQSSMCLPAEMIRDQALVVSGLMVSRLGGASIRPYQPEGYYQFLNFPRRGYDADIGERQYRRGVYMHWQRQFLHPMLKAFDAPSREECTAQRPISNTPLAALTLLNDPTFVECARVLASGALLRGGDTAEARIRWMWLRATSRAPEPAEVQILLNLHAINESLYKNDPASATELTSIGLTPVPAEMDRLQLAAWTQVARAILNLNECIVRN